MVGLFKPLSLPPNVVKWGGKAIYNSDTTLFSGNTTNTVGPDVDHVEI